MLTLREELGRLGASALKQRYPDATIPDVLPVDRSQKADFQSSAAMQLARVLKRPPREIADALSAAYAEHPAVARAEVAGAGFVNLALRDAWLATAAPSCTTLRDVGRGAVAVIDYSSPNVAKPMHIGHIRSTILGDAVKRVMRATGYTVVADNHLGDWGTQFGKLLVAWRRWLDPAAFEAAPVNELLRIYVKYTDEEKKQRAAMGAAVKTDGDDEDAAVEKDAPELLREARAELVKLQRGDAENVALWRRFIDVSMGEFNRIYNRLDVRFDEVLGESAYNDRLAGTVERLLAEGIAEHSEGAVVVTFEKARDGEAMPPLLVRKADGGFLYGSTDVATVLYREERWHPSRVIYVTDERQQLHFRQFFAVARRLGVTTSLEHVWFGLMRLPEGTISTRDGGAIGLESLLDEAERRALDVARQCNPDLADDEAREVARKVGIGAVKYNDLSRDRTTLVTFTWDKALALTGNTAPYLQYTHARIRSILRKAAEQGFEAGEIGALEASERALAVRLLSFDEAVDEVSRTSRPHLLCDYLYELATAYSTFYNESPVLKAEAAVRASRLRLCELTVTVLREGLALLGIEAPERM
jgi:arginyl-tRNA synthetase